jgi:hypothetical protein
MSRYSISLESSGDLIKDGFESESVAYDWLVKHLELEDGYIVEKEEEDE